jgi:hypothetical protein
MKRSSLILSSLAAVLAVSSVAWAQEALVAANATILSQVRSAVLLQKGASATQAQAAAATPRRPAKFELQHASGRWTLWPNDNPSGLDIHVYVGDSVELTVSNVETGRGGGISLVITGLNVREWIQPGESTVVNFNAKEPAVYRIEGVGLIVVHKK